MPRVYSPTLLFTIFAVIVKYGSAEFNCTDNGYFPDPDQCDKYYSCYNGKGEEKLCPDGLVFDETLAPNSENCNYPFIAECPENKTMQIPRPAGDKCPRQNGYFVHPEPNVCDEYYECSNGLAVLRICPTGLHFNPYTGTCVWKSESPRTGCETKKEIVSLDGFSCPGIPQFSHNGNRMFHARYLKEDDCRYYYVCIDGKIPELVGCPEGQVFNDVTLICDAPSNVPGCENYYGAPAVYDYQDINTFYEDYDSLPVQPALPPHVQANIPSLNRPIVTSSLNSQEPEFTEPQTIPGLTNNNENDNNNNENNKQGFIKANNPFVNSKKAADGRKKKIRVKAKQESSNVEEV